VSAHVLHFLAHLGRISVTDGGSCYCDFDEVLMTIKELKEQSKCMHDLKCIHSLSLLSTSNKHASSRYLRKTPVATQGHAVTFRHQ
jgi:hypothetical protein